MDNLPRDLKLRIFRHVTDIRTRIALESLNHHYRELLSDSQWFCLDTMVIRMTAGGSSVLLPETHLKFGSYTAARFPLSSGGRGKQERVLRNEERRHDGDNLDGIEDDLNRFRIFKQIFPEHHGGHHHLHHSIPFFHYHHSSSSSSSGSGGSHGGSGGSHHGKPLKSPTFKHTPKSPTTGKHPPKSSLKSVKSFVRWHVDKCPELNTLIIDYQNGHHDKELIESVVGLVSNPKIFHHRLRRIHLRHVKTVGNIIPFLRYHSNVTVSLFIDDQALTLSKHLDLFGKLDAVEAFDSVHIQFDMLNPAQQSRSAIFAARVSGDNRLYCRQNCKKVDEDGLLDGLRRLTCEELRHFQLSISPIPVSCMFRGDFAFPITFLYWIQSLDIHAHGYFQLPTPQLLLSRCPQLCQLKLRVAEESSQAINPVAAIVKEYLSLRSQQRPRYSPILDAVKQPNHLVIDVHMKSPPSAVSSSMASLHHRSVESQICPIATPTSTSSDNKLSSDDTSTGTAHLLSPSIGAGGLADNRFSASENSLLQIKLEDQQTNKYNDPAPCCLAVRRRRDAEGDSPGQQPFSSMVHSPVHDNSPTIWTSSSTRRNPPVVYLIFRLGRRKVPPTCGRYIPNPNNHLRTSNHRSGLESRRKSCASDDNVRRLRARRDRFASIQPSSVEGQAAAAEFFAPLPRLGPEMECQQFGVFSALKVPENHFTLHWEKY